MLRMLRDDFLAACHHLQLGLNEGYTLVAFPKHKEHVVVSDFVFYEVPGNGVEEYMHGSQRYQWMCIVCSGGWIY